MRQASHFHFGLAGAAALILAGAAPVYAQSTAGPQASGGGAPRAAQPAGDAARGKELYYVQGCYGCHGYTGETGVQKLVGPEAPIVADEQTFIKFLRLRADYAPTVPAERMPNYSKQSLSDRDARDIYAYIRTFKLDAPKVEDVPTFRKILELAETRSPAAGN